MKHFYQNIGENWFTYSEFYSYVLNKTQNNSHFVEIGSWKGRSASFMAVEIINSGKNIKFDCVDTWKGSEEHIGLDCITNDTLYQEFLNNIKPVSNVINPIRMSSVEASKLYPDKNLDFVFIDACHSYECVKEDIEHWLPKVKNNGIISGHDIACPEVQKAVIEKLQNFNYAPQWDVWIYKVMS